MYAVLRDVNSSCAYAFIDTQALNSLLSLLNSSHTFGPENPAFLPPPQHLALISTLIVHPSLTTRAKSPEHLQAAALAIKYLRLVYHSIGPLNAQFYDAFAFSSPSKSSRRGISTRKFNSESESPSGEEGDSINNELANTESLWTNGEDFWHVLGWVFNCSIAHQKRWIRWQIWLDLMMLVLETDWDQRDSEQKAQSLIVAYINVSNGVHGGAKRILRAIFADGSTRSLQEFKEIWKNETRERKPQNGEASDSKGTIMETNIEAGNYGDYLSSDSEAGDGGPEQNIQSPPTPTNSSTASLPDGSLLLGGSGALCFRLRMLSLLSKVASSLPESFTDIFSFYDMCLVHIRPLPVSTFAVMISPLGLQSFSPATASSLAQFILRSLISSAAPSTDRDDLTQEVLERCYLPWSANTISIDDNIKVSLCVETLFVLLENETGVQWSENLVDVVEKGIDARDKKAKKEGKRKGEAGGGGTESNKFWLRASAERIRGVVYMAEPMDEMYPK